FRLAGEQRRRITGRGGESKPQQRTEYGAVSGADFMPGANVSDDGCHHPRLEERTNECGEVHQRHVGRGGLCSHLLFGPVLKGDPALGEENRRIPKASKHEDHYCRHQYGEVVDRWERVHCDSFVDGGSATLRPSRIYDCSAKVAAAHSRRIAAAAAAPSLSAAGS